MPEVLEKRTRSSKTHSLGGRKFAWDGTIGSIHYEDNGWQNIDNEFLPVSPPWDWEMLKAGYHIRVKEDFTAGQIIEFEVQGETNQFQPMAFEWTNDLDQIQLISMPQNVTPVITNPIVDLLPTVGVPSHQGTIRWPGAYGQGIDFEWKCTSTRLAKILEIENLNNLPIPEQYIIDGGNPVLRLNLIFDPPNKNDVDIIVDGEVWNRTSKKQTFNIIEFVKDGEVLWGFMPLRYWGSGTDPETNEGQSIATLEKRGNKLYISIRVPYSWLQTAVYPVFIDTDVNEQVGAGADDCSRILLPTPSWSLTGFEFSVGSYWAVASAKGGGMRFQTVAIEGDIGVAYLVITSGASDSGTEVKSRISAEKVDDAPEFADNAAAFDTRWANRTDARVDWDNIPTWSTAEEGPDTTSPEIKTVIQEIVDRGGWASGQDIVIFWEDFEDRTAHDHRERRAYSWEQDPARAAQLHIEYEEAGGVTHLGAATLSGVGTLASIGQGIFIGQATLSGEGALVGIGRLIAIGKATLSGVGTLSAIGSFWKYGVATLAGVGTLASSGVITAIGKATLSGVGTLAAIGRGIFTGQVTLSGVGSLSAIGQRITYGVVSLVGTGTLVASAVSTLIGKATLSGVGSLSAIGSFIRYGVAALTGQGTLVANGVITAIGQTTLSGVGTLAAIGTVVVGGAIHYGVVALSGVGTLTVSGVTTLIGKATLSGVGSLSAIGSFWKYGAATLSGAGTLVANGVITAIGKVTLSGVGSLSAILTKGKAYRLIKAFTGRDLADSDIRAIRTTENQPFPWIFPLWFSDVKSRGMAYFADRVLKSFTGRDVK